MPILNYLWIILRCAPRLGDHTAYSAPSGRTSFVNTVAVGSTGLSFLARSTACREFTQLCSRKYPWGPAILHWIIAGDFRAGFDLQSTISTVVMLLVVTGSAALNPHILHRPTCPRKRYYRFFSYLNLFMFFMLSWS